MATFDRSYTTVYWAAIVSIALMLYVVSFSSYLTLNNRDLEIWVRGHSRSFKMVPFVTMPLSCISSEIKPAIGRKS